MCEYLITPKRTLWKPIRGGQLGLMSGIEHEATLISPLGEPMRFECRDGDDVMEVSESDLSSIRPKTHKFDDGDHYL